MKRYLGFVVAVCTFATLVVTPPPPHITESGATVRNYFIHHHDGVAISALLLALAALAVALLAERRGTLVAVPTLVGAGLVAALAHAAPSLDDSTTRLAYVSSTEVLYVAPAYGAAILALFAATEGRGAWRAVSLTVALLSAAGAVVPTLSASAAPALIGFLARLLFALWCIWLGLRHEQGEGSVHAASPASQQHVTNTPATSHL